ncbi:MAG: PINc/VapC family ATPase [Candidatus Hydrothermarchaeales archaeon]
MTSEQVIVPDTSVIVDGRITKLVAKSKDRFKVVIPEAVVAELENQANKGKESGFSGLEELALLRSYLEKGRIELEFVGKRPDQSRLRDIDDIIRNTAKEVEGTLVTSDRVQAKVGQTKGILVRYLEPKRIKRRLKILGYFDDQTMSVHLKEKVPPMAKRGRPGDIKLVTLSEKPLRKSQLQKMAIEIIEYAKADADSFVEIERKGATVVQVKQMRISIARPPFSDGYEITAVRPIAKVGLQDYSMSERLVKRLEGRAEGIFIAGPPGAGKSTFSQALAEFYKNKGKIVKTMESPRDLVVSDDITQYSPLEGNMEKTADILLLVRPDYTIYDELRKTKDFQIFADMRLSGVGMVGVVHATRAIDAIQRLIKRVELGMIPQIVDTVIYIKDGWIRKVYRLESSVKVPVGMTEADLARPVIEVKDFETGKTEYEIYTFGDETIVMSVEKSKPSAIARLASERVVERLSKVVPRSKIKAELKDNKVVVWLEDRYIPKVIGRGGKKIEKLERELGISLDIRSIESQARTIEPHAAKEAEILSMQVKESPRYIHLVFDKKDMGKTVNVNINGKFLFMATIGRKAEIKTGKHNEIGERILTALEAGEEITAQIV